MNRLIVFWKKDLINKLIALISLSLAAGGLLFFYLVATMPAGKSLAGAVSEYLPRFASSTPEMALISPIQVTSTPKPATPTLLPALPATATATLTAQPPTPTLEPVGSTATPESSLSNACIPNQPHQTGAALDVIDGNTVKVLIDDSVYVVRYIGVSVQDPSTPFGRAAAIENARLVFGKQLILVSDNLDKDSAGHLLRYVLVGETFINRELIDQGLASALDTPSDFTCAQAFKAAQQSAITAKLGQWSVAGTLPLP